MLLAAAEHDGLQSHSAASLVQCADSLSPQFTPTRSSGDGYTQIAWRGVGLTFGAYSLWPAMQAKSTPMAATSTGIFPTAWLVSQ